MSKKNKSKRILELPNNTAELTEVKPDILYRIQSVRNLTDSTFVLRIDKHNLSFIPGQHITLGIPGDTQLREYSVYSPAQADYLEVIIKEVEDGLVSKKLKKLKKGDIVNVEGPFGFFTPDMDKLKSHKFLFIATGTGIAPFHSIVKSHPEIDYKILHGVRYANECYESSEYEKGRYTGCTSRDENGYFKGYVTDYLKQIDVDSNTLVYLCGNYEMIQDVYDQLTSKGLSSDNIRTEVYF